jgi:hypothetical protein
MSVGLSVADWGLSGGGAFASSGIPLGSFAVRECAEPDGALRVMLVGELDMGAAEDLSEGLARVEPHRRPVRLDLSQLQFIDCCGLRAMLTSVADGRPAGGDHGVEPALLWPLGTSTAAA